MYVCMGVLMCVRVCVCIVCMRVLMCVCMCVCVCVSLLSKNIKIKKYIAIILPVALYGCETWSLTLRENVGSGVFENWVVRRRFGSKRDDVTGE